MGTTDTSLSPRPRRPPPTPGPPAEVWFWRVLPKKGRGEHRTLADNVQYDGWEEIWCRRPLAPGRYRIEFRDARRAIVRVQYANVPDPRSGERPYFTTGRARRPQRIVPSARPAWEPRPAPRPASAARPTKPGPQAAAAARPTRVTPPHRPPGVAPSGMQWRLRQKGDWELFDVRQEIPKNCHELRMPSGEFILVYSPDGTWPGYVRTRLSDGRPCLVPSSTG